MNDHEMTDEIVIRMSGIYTRHVDDLFLASRYGFRDMFRFRAGSGVPKNMRHRERYSLKDINLTIRKNEFVGILGTAGSGKTVLANILGGLIDHDGGVLESTGQIMLISRIGRGLRPMLSVAENAYFKAALWGVKPAETEQYVRDVLAFANLSELGETPLFNLSPLQERNLSLALAFLLDHEIMVFDDVSISGDEEVNRRCFARLDALKEKSTIIFITEKPAIPEKMANRIIILENGELKTQQDFNDSERDYQSSYNEKVKVSAAEHDLEADERDSMNGIAAELDTEARAIRKNTAVAKIYKMWIDDEVHNVDNPAWYLFRKGDSVKVKIIIVFQNEASIRTVRLGLHRPFDREPIAESFHKVSDFVNSGTEIISANRGSSIVMTFAFTVPDLPRNPFGITINLDAAKKSSISSRGNLKVMHFFPVDASETGDKILLDVTELEGSLD